MAVLDASTFHRNMTPLIRPIRLNGGTLYVFPSASEDIGLNLNKRDNRVALTYWALLDIPNADSGAQEVSANSDSDLLNGAYEASADDKSIDDNRLNIFNIISAANNYLDNTDAYTSNGAISNNQLSSVKLAASLQNYAMNFETVLCNDGEYDYSAAATVSEHVFWKWLKETSAIRWEYAVDDSTGGKIFYDNRPIFREEDENDVSKGYQRVVKCFGKVDAANSVSNEFGMFNETYVNIPTSYGQTECFFAETPDDNYKLGHVYNGMSDIFLEGRNSDSNSSVIYTGVNEPFYDYVNDDTSNYKVKVTAVDGNSSFDNPWAANSSQAQIAGNSNCYITDREITQDNVTDFSTLNNVLTVENTNAATKSQFKRSKVDAVSLVLDYDLLNYIWSAKNENLASLISSYDSFATDTSLAYGTTYDSYDFDFNAVLLYYTVYNKDSDVALATNLFGVIFLNGPESTTTDSGTGTNLFFTIPTFTKRMSNGQSSSKEFGSGYSFRVNIKTSSIYDNTDAYIQDNTTSDSIYTADFNGVVSQLNDSVSLLKKQTSLVQAIQNDYLAVTNLYNAMTTKVNDLQNNMNKLMQSRFTEIDTSYISVSKQDASLLNATKLNAGTGAIGSLDVSTLTTDSATFSSTNSDLIDTSLLRGQTLSAKDSVFTSGAWKSENIYQKFPDVSTALIDRIVLDTSVRQSDSGGYLVINDSSALFPQAFNPTAATDNAYEVDYAKYVPVILKFLQEIVDKNLNN